LKNQNTALKNAKPVSFQNYMVQIAILRAVRVAKHLTEAGLKSMRCAISTANRNITEVALAR
jgi:hypothetical protein